MTDPYQERRDMKRLKEYIDMRGYVADAEYGIPTRYPCGGSIVREVAAEEAYDSRPGQHYEADGLHFRQPWVCVVEEEFQKLRREIKNPKEVVERLTARVAELEKIN